MKSTIPFYQYLNKFLPLSFEEFENFFLPRLAFRHFKKKEIVTRAGEVENYMNFILNGVAREYYIDKGCQFNTQISYEGHIIHSQESFHQRTPSEFFIDTLEPVNFLSITYNDLEAIFLKNQKMERLGRMIFTHLLMMKDRRHWILTRLSPRERFLRFVNRHPELLQRVPQKHLASFLNIKPETFSRFKHLLMEKDMHSGS